MNLSTWIPTVFNNSSVLPLGWYWALPSKDLKWDGKVELNIFGEKLLLYRGHSNQVYCISAHCPHMGAHLKEGKIEGDSIRCGFHGWKFSGDGICTGIPCGKNKLDPKHIPKRSSYLTTEKYGMIWINSDPDAKLENSPVPYFPVFENTETTSVMDQIEIRECHPTIILGGGVDEEHFLFVHGNTTKHSGPLKFEHQQLTPEVIEFQNSLPISGRGIKTSLLRRLYGGVLRYKVTYWHGTTAFAELGFSWFPLYSIFAYRPTKEGKTEGLNIYVTRKRFGPLGWLISKAAIFMTRSILRKGGGEDRIIQNSIKFNPSPYAFMNGPFFEFAKYVDRQAIRKFHPIDSVGESL